MNEVTPVEIVFNEDGDTFKTTAFQLLQWKHALRLEAKGITMSRGQKVSTHLRKRLGQKRNFPIADLSAWVESTLEDLLKHLELSP